jgi:hypothetical protein
MTRTPQYVFNQQTIIVMKKFFNLSAVAILSCSIFAASAQDKKTDAPAAAPAATPAPAAEAKAPVATPKHSCAQPADPGRLTSDNQAKQFRKDMDTYRECLSSYATDMRRIAEAHVGAGNAAVEEFNTYAKSVTDKQNERNKEAEKDKEKAKK